MNLARYTSGAIRISVEKGHFYDKVVTKVT